MAKPQVNGIGSSFHFDDLEEALAAFKQGAMLVVVDDEDRENEGDLIIAASHATTEAMAFIVRHTRSVGSMPVGLTHPAAISVRR